MPSPSNLIVGAGRLGSRVGRLLTKSGFHVTAETLTPTSHDQLESFGMFPRLKSSNGSFDSVLFAIPPSGNPASYDIELKRALSLWNQKGPFVFISSSSVYAEENGGVVTETSQLSHSQRAQTLIQAETQVIRAEGLILRLSGLYDETSGPHTYYVSQKTSDLRADGLINLIHYDDAAEISFLLLQSHYPGQLFLGSDNSPITRQQLVSIWAQYQKQKSQCEFLGVQGPIGKRVDSSKTRTTLKWKPKHSSFEDFVNQLK